MALSARAKTMMFAREHSKDLEKLLVRGDPNHQYALIGKILMRALGGVKLDHEENAARFAEKLRRLT